MALQDSFRRISRLLFCLCFSLFASAQAFSSEVPFVRGQVIVRFVPSLTHASIGGLLHTSNLRVDRALIPSMNLYLVKLKSDMTVREALSSLRALRGVMYAQADHVISLRDVIPNDPLFERQWSFLNTASKIDISATKAWALGTGGRDRNGDETVIAVVDGGMDIEQPDLKPNVWVNPGEIAGNGIDDDGNGYIDDVNGWNAFDNTGKIPATAHGTHVAGIAGARGNNGAGVAGINWNVKLMAVAAASSSTSIVAAGYGYVIANKQLWLSSHGAKGANVVATNSSFGVDFAQCESGEYPVWNDLYNKLGELGVLSAVATANMNIDVDTKGDVPTGCSSPYLIKVTNTDKQDLKNADAGYGLKMIDLGAPGTDILSLLPGNQTGLLTGTSMATPHVAGTIAFMHSVASSEFSRLYKTAPAKAGLQLRSLLLQSVDKIPSMSGLTTSGGRLNLGKAAEAIHAFKP